MVASERRWRSTSPPVTRPHDDEANDATRVVADERRGVLRCGAAPAKAAMAFDLTASGSASFISPSRVVPSPYEERKIVMIGPRGWPATRGTILEDNNHNVDLWLVCFRGQK
ncbi:hypothetical protein GUJ93_ZPchr0016g2513 [Zizania palustris]|uniref:Uncharacterized protein n=1 Tax=Zizania palustris TaxID=103762 RepID=A0A8J5TDI3_ZIZPA|nr:hypothetical protein GUJ93_ZPchr0016g2513 [Zizania palustris]